jgi:hypothetical protein
MEGLKFESSLVQPLHPACDMSRFVKGKRVGRIGRDHTKNRQRREDDTNDDRHPLRSRTVKLLVVHVVAIISTTPVREEAIDGKTHERLTTDWDKGEMSAD